MLFRLARQLGKTVGELLYGPMPISAWEVAQWRALWKLEENQPPAAE